MNTIRTAFLAVVMMLPMCMFAQFGNFEPVPEETEFVNYNRDENGNINRGSYLTNPWYSNWSIGLAGGLETMVSGTGANNSGFDLGTARITPSLEVSLMKWFTPCIAARFGVQGLWLQENFPGNNYQQNHYLIKHEDGVNYFNNTYMYANLMWNFINTVWGYRANRFYNVVPYINAGYLRLTHPDQSLFTKEYRDREVVLGFGVYNTFRINNAFQATLDLRWGNFSGRYHDLSNGGRVNHFNVTVGVAYNIEKWYWARVKGVEEQRDVAKAELIETRKEIVETQQEAKELKTEVVYLNQNVEDKTEEVERLTRLEYEARKALASLILYYEIDVSKLNFSEQHHLDEFVARMLQQDPRHVFYLTGSADKGTGTMQRNIKLSHDRAEGVKAILMNKYGIPEDQIVIKSTIVSEEHENGELDRCVLIEKE